VRGPSIWWAGRVVGRERSEDGTVHQLHADVGAVWAAEIEAALDRLYRFIADDFAPIGAL
jgi:hypothetical protein